MSSIGDASKHCYSVLNELFDDGIDPKQSFGIISNLSSDDKRDLQELLNDMVRLLSRAAMTDAYIKVIGTLDEQFVYSNYYYSDFQGEPRNGSWPDLRNLIKAIRVKEGE